MINALSSDNQLVDTPDQEASLGDHWHNFKAGLNSKLPSWFKDNKQVIAMALFVLLVGPVALITSRSLVTDRSDNRTQAAYGTPELTFVPASIEVNPGETVSVNVFANPAGYSVAAAQVEVKYDPAFLQLTEIRPGQVLTEVLLNEHDPSTGTIKYTIGSPCQDGTGCQSMTASGFVATLVFSTQATSGQTALNFIKSTTLEPHTELAMKELDTPVAFSAGTAAIALTQPSPSPVASLAPSPVASTPPSDTEAPTVSFASPADGARIKANSYIQVSAQATDNVKVASVMFMLDGRRVCESLTQPYGCSINVGRKTNITRKLSAIATDSSGNKKQVDITISIVR